jgi:hypothetical protein
MERSSAAGPQEEKAKKPKAKSQKESTIDLVIICIEKYSIKARQKTEKPQSLRFEA